MTVRRGTVSHNVVVRYRISPNGMAMNFERLGLDASAIEAVVLSHGPQRSRWRLSRLARLRGRIGLPLTVHPLVFSRRRFVVPDQGP